MQKRAENCRHVVLRSFVTVHTPTGVHSNVLFYRENRIA